MTRRRAQSIGEVLTSLTTSPYLVELAEHLDGSAVGRRRKHPTWVVLAYGALARHFRSHNRLDGELRTGLWDSLRRSAMAQGLADPGRHHFSYAQLVYWRDQLMTDPERREAFLAAFTDTALVHARQLGLLHPNGPGSITHPDRSRIIYGDGTVVRPAYRRPRSTTVEDPDTGEEHVVYIDPVSGEHRDTPAGRYDPSAADYHRWDGPIHGNSYVIAFARGEEPGQRVVLGVDRVAEPGREADTAVALIERICAAAGPGITAALYDGALRGVHIDRLMRTSGLVVINKVHLATAGTDDAPPTARRRPLGIFTHTKSRRICAHTLHIDNGTVVDIALADDGTPVIVGSAVRRQVKRFRRADGTYRFSLGIDVPCGRTSFALWLSPHGTDDDPTLPDHLRLLPPDDPDFARLYGRRNDSESFNSQYKRSLLVDRATSVGWERQLFDLATFAILENSRSWPRQHRLAVAS